VAVVPQETPADVPFTVRQMVMLGRYAHLDMCGEESDKDRAIVDASLSSVNASDLGDRANLHDAYGCQIDVSWSEGAVVRAKFV